MKLIGFEERGERGKGAKTAATADPLRNSQSRAEIHNFSPHSECPLGKEGSVVAPHRVPACINIAKSCNFLGHLKATPN